MRYLDPVALAKLKGLSLQLKRLSAEGHATGRHRSLWKGFSRDFAQHRPYAPGDELKSLDWKVYARADRFFVREYRAESVLATHVLLDASGSMAFAAGARAPKWEHACRLGMALAYLVLAEGDSAGLATFDSRPRDFLPPRSSFSQLDLIDQTLARARPQGETDLSLVLERTARRLKRRSFVILISDLLGPPQAVLDVIKAFKARKHEILVLQVLDPQERDFRYDGPTVFESLEDGAELFCEAGALSGLYRSEFEKLMRLYEAAFHGSEIAYAPFYTDVPWEVSLGRFLARRQLG